MTPRPERQRLYYGWVIAGSASLILYAAYGVQYSFGVFLPEMERALAPGERAALSLGFAVYSVLYALFSLLSGRMTDVWGPRRVVMVGGVLLGMGILLAGQATNLWQYYIYYGFLAALGMSAVFVPATATVVKWFVARGGMAVGIVTTGAGVGQLTIPLLSALLIAAWGWRTTYFAYGLALALVLILAGMWMERDPESVGLKPYGVGDSSWGGDAAGVGEEWSLRPSEAVRTPAFWLYTAALFLFWSVVFLPVVHLPSFARDALGASAGQGALTLTALAAGSTLGRFAGGSTADLLGRRRAFILLVGVQVFGFLGLLLASPTESLALAYAAAVALGVGLGGTTAVYPVYAGHLFGRLYAGSISGIIFAIAGAATGIGVYLAGAIQQATGSYVGAFAIGGGLTLLSLPLILRVRPPRSMPSYR
ncbi:MAG: MFS transporter [Dehalococcoidia bacterium]